MANATVLVKCEGTGHLRAKIAARKGRILLVDARRPWLAFVTHVLERRGHSVFVAPSEAKALVFLRGGEKVDVVVSALRGGGTGRVARAAKALLEASTIAMTHDGSDLSGLERGTVDLALVRPVPIGSLVSAIESFLWSEQQARG